LLCMSKSDNEIKYIARNRKARHDYEIKSKMEAGIELLGSEVKSLREGKVNLSDSYALIENGEVYLKKLHITPYKQAQDALDPLRTRRLLLHKREIRKLFIQTEQRGATLIPLSLYFKQNLVKVELAVAVGRKKYDKRQSIEKADVERKLRRTIRRDL